MEESLPKRKMDAESVLYGQYTTEHSYTEAPITIADSESMHNGQKFKFQRSMNHNLIATTEPPEGIEEEDEIQRVTTRSKIAEDEETVQGY